MQAMSNLMPILGWLKCQLKIKHLVLKLSGKWDTTLTIISGMRKETRILKHTKAVLILVRKSKRNFIQSAWEKTHDLIMNDLNIMQLFSLFHYLLKLVQCQIENQCNYHKIKDSHCLRRSNLAKATPPQTKYRKSSCQRVSYIMIQSYRIHLSRKKQMR